MSSAARANGRRLGKILLVEDDEDMRRMMAHVLRAVADVIEAADGEDALELLVEHRPGVVVSDVMMPRLDGIELTRAVKGDEALRRTPVILVTAKDHPRDIVDGINAGARHYLTKPFSPQDLVAKVEKALAKR